MSLSKIQEDKLSKIVQSLDIAAGMMIVTAMSGNKEVKEAMEIVSQASFLIGELINE